MSRPLLAITRDVPDAILRCELTHLPRVPIDLSRARVQHRAYERRLEALGCVVVRAAAAPDLPDSVFVEDTAVVLDEVAVITRPGAPSRRSEGDGVAAILAAHRPLVRMEGPGSLDGGDVLRLGRRLLVGASGRSDAAGVSWLRDTVAPYGYTVEAVPLHGCLHLKTAVTEVADGVVLMAPRWVDADAFSGYERVEVHPDEPFAGNALRVGDAVVVAEAHPRTAERLSARGLEVHAVDADELAKAEAGLTCCSVLVPPPAA
jgi:dimethylargininase